MNVIYGSLRSVLLFGLSVLGICLSTEASAQSAVQVTITSGNAKPIVLTNPESNSLFTINGWTIDSPFYNLNFTNGTGGGGISGGSGVICTSSPCAADPLEIEVSATGFNERVAGFELAACCQDIPAGFTRELAAFWSASDGLDMTTTPITGSTFTGPLYYGSSGTFGRADAGPSPYSLTVVDTFTADNVGLSLDSPDATAIFYLSPKVPVSEPAPLLLFGGGLLLLGITRRKRVRPAKGTIMRARYRGLFSAFVLVCTPAALLVPLRAHAGPSFYTVTLATGNLVNPAVNDSGQRAGSAYVYSAEPGQPPVNAFLYNSNGTKIDLGTLGAPHSLIPQSFGVAINDLGQVTGSTTVATSYGYKAFLYSNGTMQDLGTFAPSLNTESVSIPTDINNLGQVVGLATASEGGEYLAFLYSNGKMQDIGTLGGLFSEANGINDSSQVVGVSDTAKSGFAGTDAFLYSDGSMYNLNSLIGSASSAVWLTSATEINDQGQILADGVDIYNHERYDYLLTPTNTPPTCGTICKVSEPGTLGLLGVGLVGLGLTLRRRAPSYR